MVSFDTGVEAAVRAATEVTTAGVPVRTPCVLSSYHRINREADPSCGLAECVEFLDALTMKAINQGGLAGRQFEEKDTLFFKLQG